MIGGARLEAGAGGRPLLLVHGFTGAKEDFGDYVEPLAARGWHVVAPDLRGHGGALKPEEEDAYGLDVFADDLVVLVEELGWSRFTLLGHSMGGMVAQVLAVRMPERLDGLVLMDTTHGPLPRVDPALVELGITVAREHGVEALLAATKLNPDPLDNPAHDRLVRERAGYQEFCDGKFLASSPVMWAAMLPALLGQADRLDALRRLDIPVLVVVGELDRGFRTVSARMAEEIPGARLVVIDGAGHSPQFEQPDAWWAAVSGFLDEVAGAG